MKSLINSALTATTIALGAFSMATTASAQSESETELCGTVLEPEDIVGSYTMTLGNALLFGEGKTVPLKDSQTMQVTIAMFGGGLVMESGGFAVDLELVGEDDTRNWTWEALKGVIAISSEDYEKIVDCEVFNLPRLIGEGMSTSQEGTPIKYTYNLIAEQWGDSGATMFGSLKWSGGGMEMQRAVRLVATDW